MEVHTSIVHTGSRYTITNQACDTGMQAQLGWHHK